MKQTFSDAQLAPFLSKLETESGIRNPESGIDAARAPVHVVYGGAHLFTAETPAKLGKIALRSIETYAPNFADFARAMWLNGADALPVYADAVRELETRLSENAQEIKAENFAAWFAWTIYRRTIEKLNREPIEDFRIDFEDGYGFRSDREEDEHAISASNELAKMFNRESEIVNRESKEEKSGIRNPESENNAIANRKSQIANSYELPFSGFRVKSFQAETRRRAVRTLDLFLTNFLEKTAGKLPENFVVTLPKITRCEEVEVLADLLGEFERKNKLETGRIKIEIMIETPESIVGETGEIVLRKLVEAGGGRVASAHFGAYDYTASFGISGTHQHLRHEACVFARQLMQIALAPLSLRLSDSVTTEMPVAVHKGENLSEKQIRENFAAVRGAWRTHFNNVTLSQINGFYQSWDLHPAQLAARYAAVYAFFLESAHIQSKRLKGFIEKATQANLTGNVFDDAASAEGLLNFFARARNCGALTAEEIAQTTGLTDTEFASGSFSKIMAMRASI